MLMPSPWTDAMFTYLSHLSCIQGVAVACIHYSVYIEVRYSCVEESEGLGIWVVLQRVDSACVFTRIAR